MSDELTLPDIECRQCCKVIDWNGKCKCEQPYAPMTAEEYDAHFVHPSIRRAMPSIFNKPAGSVQ